MAVSEVHRFLYGKKTNQMDKRIWILGGYTTNWFYHNYLHGCIEIEKTIKLWAFENNFDVVTYFDLNGELSVDSPFGYDNGKDVFENAQPKRTPKYGNSVTGQVQTIPISDTTNIKERMKGSAEVNSGSVQNKITKITNLLLNKDKKSLIVFKDFRIFLKSLELNPQTSLLAHEIFEKNIKVQWPGIGKTRNLMIFVNSTDENYEFMKTEVMPDRDEVWKSTVEYTLIPPPSAAEISQVIQRLTLRHNFSVNNIDEISNFLLSKKSLIYCVNNIRRHICENKKTSIDISDLLELPPINQTEIDSIKKEIRALVGLRIVKEMLENIEITAKERRIRLMAGESILNDNAFHMIFTGSAGTGKTTVAKIVARIFNAIGILKTNKVIEVTASKIMSSFVNETGENMERIINESLDGVLFIDEAHQFGDPESKAAKEAIQSLVPNAWNHRHQLVIILAGYHEKMADFFNMDAGLERRFPRSQRVEFKDYSIEDMMQIAASIFEKQNFTYEQKFEKQFRNILKSRTRLSTFGNAGGVKNLVNEVVEKHLASEERNSKTLTISALPPLLKRNEQVLNNALEQLDNMIGQEDVKVLIEKKISDIQYVIQREESENCTGDLSIPVENMLFVGPPGTGKTTMAQIITDVLFGLGCLEKHLLKTVSKENIVGKYVGETEHNMKKIIESARGGVLFIDEAYTLVEGGESDYGKQALNVLLSQMLLPENSNTVFILAGYQHKIRNLLSHNEGLRRRFPKEICFSNLSPSDCSRLAQMNFKKLGFEFEVQVLDRIKILADEEIKFSGINFGNAGWVNSMTDEILSRLRMRVVQNQIHPSSISYKSILLCDVPES